MAPTGKKRIAAVAAVRPKPVNLEPLEDEALQMAREEIDAEVALLKRERDPEGKFGPTGIDLHAFNSAWEEAYKAELFLPSRGKDGEFGIPVNKAEILASHQHQFEILRSKVEKDSKKAAKVEQKMKITMQGYVTRQEKLNQSLASAFDSFNSVSIEVACFQMLRSSEERSLPHRLKVLTGEKEAAEHTEAVYQSKFAALQKMLIETEG